MDYSSYSLKTAPQVIDLLRTSFSGLSSQEVIDRQQLYGPNKLNEVERSAFGIYLAQFRSPMILLILAAAAVSFFLSDIMQAILIFSFVFINTTFSFYQEYKSEQVLQLLKKHLQLTARVHRNDVQMTIKAEELVPGDIIILEPGDLIPAEVRFIQSNGLMIDESIISGESFPVIKTHEPVKQGNKELASANIGILGTMVISGTGVAVVFAIGAKTALGNISNLVINVIRNNNFAQEINRLSGFMLWLILITLALVFVTHLIVHPDTTNIIELLTFSIALAVAITPETLPAVITFALTSGASKLAKQKVIVKRLSAIEELGNIDVLCTDKTGTLTENKLKLVDIYSDDEERTVNYATLVAAKSLTEKTTQTNSFDTALLDTLSEQTRTALAQYPRTYEMPFSPNRLRSSAVVTIGSDSILIVRGAIENISPRCIPFPLEQYTQWITEQEDEGKRVLAVAYKKLSPQDDLAQEVRDESHLTMLGAISFADPIKKDTAVAIKDAQKLHIGIKILTGDSPLAAYVVGKQIGLITEDNQDGVCSGTDFEKLTPDEQLAAVTHYSVFARVTPQHKYKIVELLKKNYRVGFLGEGFNDAPALKIADVGIVVQEATDVAREAADIILLGKGLNVIINGIKQGRLVFNNILKYLQIVLSSSFGNFYSIAVASFFIDFLPLLPLQILLVNLLSDFPMIAIASDTVDTAELRKPKRYNLKNLAFFIIIFGIISAPFDFVLFLWFRHTPSLLQTNWFIESILTELVIIISLRTRLVFFRAKRMSNYLLILVFVSAIAAIIIPLTHIGQTMFHFVAPAPKDFALIGVLVISYLGATELIKQAYYRIFNARS